MAKDDKKQEQQRQDGLRAINSLPRGARGRSHNMREYRATEEDRSLYERLPGVLIKDWMKLSLKAGDRFISEKVETPGSYLYCEVKRLDGDTARCVVINGGWTITFKQDGTAASGSGEEKRHHKIIMKLPKRLEGVLDMEDYAAVIEKATKQILRGH